MAQETSEFERKVLTLKKKYPHFQHVLQKHAFTHLPWKDVEYLRTIKFPSNLHEIFVIGMGGSSLGAKVLTSVFPGHVRVSFLDNIEPASVGAGLSYLTKPGFIFASKSGETLEVLALAKILFAKRAHSKNALVITDHPESTLAKLAKKKNIQVILGEKKVPGRFSIFSESGLVPFFLSGLFEGLPEVKNLLAGAKGTSWENVFTLAAHQYLHFQNSKNMVVLFSYCERLSIFIDWYIQLLSESIGKSAKIGITPIKAIGVKDQHSQLQLFLDGPKDKFFILLKNDAAYGDMKIPGERNTLSSLFNAEYEGVKKAFQKKQIPFFEIRFPQLSQEKLGELLFFFELEIAFLGMLFGINFENQPAVELSKKYTKKLLS